MRCVCAWWYVQFRVPFQSGLLWCTCARPLTPWDLWPHRFNKAQLDKVAVERDQADLEDENFRLRSLLKQYVLSSAPSYPLFFPVLFFFFFSFICLSCLYGKLHVARSCTHVRTHARVYLTHRAHNAAPTIFGGVGTSTASQSPRQSSRRTTRC
jgi:hypothetical protein